MIDLGSNLLATCRQRALLGLSGQAPFSLGAYAADIPAAYSTARSLYNSPLAINLQLQNSNSASLNSITCTGAGLTEADLVSLRDGVGQLRVSTVYNQSSIGSKWADFVQATAGTQMVFEEADGTTQYKINGKFAQKNDNTRYLALSGGTTKTMGASWACVAVVQYTGAYSSGRAILGGSKAGVGHTWFGQHNTNNQWYYRDLTAAFADNQASMTSYDNGQVNAVWDKFSGRPLVICVRVKNGLQELYLNGWKAASDTAASPVGLNVLEWGRAALGGTLFEGYMAEAVFFENADSDGVFAYMDNAITFFGAKPIVIGAGDSRTTQGGLAQCQSGSTFPCFMVATSGHRTDQINSALTTPMANFGPRFSGDARQNVIIYDGGINDLIQGVSEATLETNVLAGLAAIRAAGFKAGLTTLAGAADQSSLTQAKLIAHNAWRAAQLGGAADFIVDCGADASIGVGQHANATYFTDGLHHTTAGYNVKGNLYAAALNALYP